ncbi:MAG: ABC transporter ATP-binding protein [Candidatus Bathyarchaeia archaeon]
MELEVRGLRKMFGGFEALKGVSFKVPSRKTITLLGPSGCGKTTTLRVIAGLLKPDEGEVLFDGKDVSRLPPRQREVGMVFQSPALFPNLTVWENIAFPLEARDIRIEEVKRRVKEVVELVGLVGLESRHPHELSRGQQQRVAIGRAISSEVNLLLLDEPLTALDESLRMEISNVIKDIQKTLGLTTVYVTHNQIEAFMMSDLVATMFDGTIDSCADIQTMYLRPPTERTARFLGFTNRLEGTAEPLNLKSFRFIAPWGELKLNWHGPKVMGRASMLFRPENASISLSGKGLLEGELLSSTFAGSNVIARVRTTQGLIECTGNDSSQYNSISEKIGKRVMIKIDLDKILLVPTNRT